MVLDKIHYSAAVLVALAIAGCGRSPAGLPKPAASSAPVVVATTSTLAALVRTVGGDAIAVHALVPIGASPETYEPTPHDLVELSRASLVVQNGAGLESWLAKLIASASPHARLLTLSDVVLKGHAFAVQVFGATPSIQSVNPHFWLDPKYAQLYVDAIARALSEIDPSNAARYRANATAEIKRLDELDAWTRQRIARVPPANRTMIVFHDAWYYFDERYGIRDVGAIEPSPGREPSAAELANLIATAKANHVRAIFAEPEFSPKLAKQLAEGAGIKTVTDLYDDSLGSTPELSTYEGMMHHNVDAIVQALGQ